MRAPAEGSLAAAPAPPAVAPVRILSPLVRVLHWGLGVCVLACLVLHEGGRAHEVFGYAALGIVGVRLLLGLAGPGAMRFAAFVRGPRAVWAYALRLRHGREERHLNHNPLGGWMVLTLLGVGFVAALTGALYVTDAFWGLGFMHALHALSAWSFALLLPLHVAGVVLASRRHHENLLLAMLHGNKRAASGDDVA